MSLTNHRINAPESISSKLSSGRNSYFSLATASSLLLDRDLLNAHCTLQAAAKPAINVVAVAGLRVILN